MGEGGEEVKLEDKGTYKSVIERHLDWRVGADPPIGYVADWLARCFGMAEVKAARRRRKAGFVGGRSG